MILHAGCVARRVAGGWRGILITGASGAGKSDLALRLIERGWRLVSDDRTVLWLSASALWGRAPDVLRHQIEARGLDVCAEPALSYARLWLAAVCEAPTDRLPDPEAAELLGAPLPLVRVAPFESSAPAKVERALTAALPQGFTGTGRGRI